ncbi:MAG: OmpA family protein [Gammaproteobacteria bacterium]|nr:OmpA family protein [Gammaproteobacteria bacterium]
MSEECECPPCEEGLPPWLATFADMMALLMCFFVLLLSFAEMDVLKFKQVAGALKLAFGVQRIVKATEIPKGTSVIAKQYSPGKPTEVTPLEIMREKASDDTKVNLDYTDSESKYDGGMGEATAEMIAQQKAEREAQAEAEELQDELAAAIGDGLLEVEAFNDRVLIRIRERGSFGSGRAELKQDFLPILKLVAEVLNQRDGHFVISGHTDDIPIETRRFRSNWDLSAARAASVVHFFIREGDVDPERMEIRALADNEPLVPNDSWENRAKNRRVEISVLHGNRLTIEEVSPAENVDYLDPQSQAPEQ